MPCSYFWGRPSENFQKPNFVELLKLGFSHSRGVANRVGQAFHEGPWDFYRVDR